MTRTPILSRDRLYESVAPVTAGCEKNPDWYYDLLADPRTTVEVGGESYEVLARVTSSEERTRIFDEQKAKQPYFAKMEAMTDRKIPVIDASDAAFASHLPYPLLEDVPAWLN